MERPANPGVMRVSEKLDNGGTRLAGRKWPPITACEERPPWNHYKRFFENRDLTAGKDGEK